MQFRYLNKRVVLHGLKENGVTEVKSKKLKLKDDDAQISMIFVQQRCEPNEPSIHSIDGGEQSVRMSRITGVVDVL